MIKILPPNKRLTVNHSGLASRLLLLTISLLMAVLAPSALYAQQKIKSVSSYTKSIKGCGYGTDNKHYYLIASPIGDVDPRYVGGMMDGNAEPDLFDLYYFDQQEKKEWRNFKSEEFQLTNGKGYLYARCFDGTLTFTDTPFDGNGEIMLSYDRDAEFVGWNLVGNPFCEVAYLDHDYYRMNDRNSELMPSSSSTGIEPMEGVFVLACEDGEKAIFSKDSWANGSSFSLDLCNSSGVIDRAVVRFGSGRQLPKFQLWESSTKLFIPIDGTDYAVVCSQGKGELPVHFKTKDNGSYTISLNNNEVRFAYLHLIDNLTGDDIDLLAHSDYTFYAKTTDDPSRFHLVFSAESMSPDSPDGTSYTPDMPDYRIKRYSWVPRMPNHREDTHQDAGDGSGEEEIVYTLIFEAGTGGDIVGDSDYAGELEDGSKITLRAIADEGYCFLNWTENGVEVSTNATYEFQIHSNRNLRANFALILKDGEENSQTIAAYEAENVIFQDRVLYMNGDWNTLCLPFNVGSFDDTPLEGFTVKELDTKTENGGHKTGFENGTLYLNFKDATSIEAGKPYIVKKGVTADLIIKSEADWKTFAQNVSSGVSYEGKVVKLGADISISTMAGVAGGKPFNGTFDGNGHTINVNLSGGGDGLALFYAIEDATIQNVKVMGNITSSNQRPATFTSFVEGNSTIKNCWSSVNIASTRTSGWIDGGGFVARVSNGATLNMIDCLFTGTVTYEVNAYSGGSMVGFTQRGSTSILTNCMYSPTALVLKEIAYKPHIFVSGDERGKLTNCYYNLVARESILENEGFDGSNMSPASLALALGANWEAGTSYAIPKMTFGINNPLFKDVTISSNELTTVTSEDGAVSFMGGFDPVSLAANDSTKFYMGNVNTLYYPSEAITINAFRAWFQLASPSSSMGDVNGDGAITISDVMGLVNYILGNTHDGFIIANADINGDNSISVTDVTTLVNLILYGNGSGSGSGNLSVSSIVFNTGDAAITFGRGGSGPARAKESTIWEE